MIGRWWQGNTEFFIAIHCSVGIVHMNVFYRNTHAMFDPAGKSTG